MLFLEPIAFLLFLLLYSPFWLGDRFRRPGTGSLPDEQAGS
jgi:hypothetical protein